MNRFPTITVHSIDLLLDGIKLKILRYECGVLKSLLLMPLLFYSSMEIRIQKTEGGSFSMIPAVLTLFAKFEYEGKLKHMVLLLNLEK
jgi:hypothetical protein